MISLKNFSIVVPFRDSPNSTRLKALLTIIRHYKKHCCDLDIIIVEQAVTPQFPREEICTGVRTITLRDDGLFNLAKTHNVGINSAKRKYIWVHDADVLNSLDAIKQVSGYSSAAILMPYDKFNDVDNKIVDELNPLQNIQKFMNPKLHPLDKGTLALQSVIPKSALPYIGLGNECFEGWGLTDGEYAHRIHKLGYPVYALNACCYHIEHELPHGAKSRLSDKSKLLGSENADNVYAANYSRYRQLIGLTVEQIRVMHNLISYNYTPPPAPTSHHYFDKNIASGIARLLNKLQVKKCIDLGCGLGEYVSLINDGGIYCYGVDANETAIKNTKAIGNVSLADLSRCINYIDPYEFGICLEVGEHIGKDQEDAVFANISYLCKKGVVLSWALPGQGGEHHVNELPNEYVERRMNEYGFIRNKEEETKLRDVASLRWFKNTIMVYIRNK